MKKLALTIAIILGISVGAIAQDKGGLMGRGDLGNDHSNWSANWATDQNLRDGNSNFALLLPYLHGSDTNESPLGTGIALLAALGGAYLVAKKRKEE